MDKKTLRALEASIRHWERMASGKRRKMINDEGEMQLEEPYADFCALCKIYYGVFCDGCPVAKFSGEMFCHKTPYYEAEDAFANYRADNKEFKQAAQKEVDFLKEVKQKYFD